MTIIAFTGIPGCGKTTIAHELSKLTNSPCLSLSEDVERSFIFKEVGYLSEFKIRLALRNLMFKNFQEAKKLSGQGNMVIVDSYYDKVMQSLLGEKGSDFIMQKKNPYFNAVYRLAKYDNFLFPDADIVVGIKINLLNWQILLDKRARNLDLDPFFRTNTFLLQNNILSSTKAYCQKRKKQYIEIDVLLNDANQMAVRILKQIHQKKRLCFAKCFKEIIYKHQAKQNG